MICPNCNKPTPRLIIQYIKGKKVCACAACRGLSENGGARVSGILTRNSDRIRAQQHDHEGDIILPHIFDKSQGKVIPNPDFVDRYAEQLPTYFTEQELNDAGYSKAGKIFEHRTKQEAAVEKEKSEVTFVADKDHAKLKETIKNA